MKIKVNLNIFLFLILFIITKQIEIYALVMIFALIHELGHLIAGILLGFKPQNFNIMPLGFSVDFKTNIKDYNRKIGKSNILSLKKIFIALAGPITNLILIIIANTLKMQENIIYANFLIILFNLLPIYPLDGGRILKSMLKLLLGNRKACKYINIISNISILVLTFIASIVILILKNISIFLIIIVLWFIIIKENKRYNLYNKIYKEIDKNYNYL